MKAVLSSIKKFWQKNRSLSIILIIVLLLRLPLLFEPFTYADEGIYLTLGQAIRKGLVLYRDIHDNKPPMLYLIAALAGNFTFYRLIHFFWSFATIFVFYKLAKLLFEKNKKAINISTGVFAILTSLHTFEGNIANAENFMLLPTLGAFFLILKNLKKNFWGRNMGKNWFLAGLLLSLATLFKVPGIFDFLALLFFVFLIFTEEKQKNYRQFFSYCLLLFIGFFLPILITFIYFASQNAFSYYLKAAFFQNIPYLSSWGGQKFKIGNLPLPLLSRGLSVLLVFLLVFCFRKKLSLIIKIILIWFPFAFFAALLSSRPYPHYLIQVLPPFCLSWGLFALSKKIVKFLPLFLTGVFILVFLSFHFWYYTNLPYLVNFWQFALRLKNRQEYLNYFGDYTQNLYETANFIKNHTQPEEKIFIWGTQPSIYSLSKRLPVGRYTVSYHIVDFNGYKETIQELNNNPPRWLIDTQDEKQNFPELKNFIENSYTLFKQFGKIKIFYRLPKSAYL